MFTKLPHRQEIYFNDGSVRVIDNVIKIEQGRWFHLLDDTGVEYIINPINILFVKAKTK